MREPFVTIYEVDRLPDTQALRSRLGEAVLEWHVRVEEAHLVRDGTWQLRLRMEPSAADAVRKLLRAPQIRWVGPSFLCNGDFDSVYASVVDEQAEHPTASYLRHLAGSCSCPGRGGDALRVLAIPPGATEDASGLEVGDDWMLAWCMGNDAEDATDYYVTTNRVRASQLSAHPLLYSPRVLAEFLVQHANRELRR